MAKNAPFGLIALITVKPGLDGTLAKISTRLEQYLDAPDANAAALESVRSDLRRLIGVLKMIRLDGVIVFCNELEIVLGELAANPQQVSGMHRDALRRAVSGLTQYLDSLPHGAANAALRLFPQYQALQQLRGFEMSSKLDLFYPNLAVQLPQHVLDAPPQGDSAARLRALRSQYQQGLMRWLRRDDASATLQLMQQALDGVLCCMPQDEGRAFWWVTNGLLDCLRIDSQSQELNVHKLLGRIDQQIRAVTDGNAGDMQPVLNEMLYLIGISHTASSRVNAIKQVYRLDYYLPDFSALSSGEVVQLLSIMHDQLQVAEESLELCVQGEQAACADFIEHTGQLALQGEKLDRDTLQYLTRQIQAFSLYVKVPEQAQLIAMDMAIALLLLDSGIKHYSSLGSDFHGQARTLFERMQASLRHQPENIQQLAKLVGLHYQMEQGDILSQLSNEMLVNLQHVRQCLDNFFHDAGKREDLAGSLHLLGQMHGGLSISTLDQADQLLLSIQSNIRRFAHGDGIPSTLEIHALNESLRALDNYLQRLAHGQAEDVAPLQEALAEMDRMRQDVAPIVTTPTEPPTVAAGIRPPAGEDQELLDVFLEEAQEVLNTMRENIEICLAHPDNREPLVVIRRGFHTLKGSGRMVGLTDLGEVAWCVERALNKCLRDNQPITQNLLDFITGAARKFAGWVDAINSRGTASIEADELIETAQQIENGIAPEQKAEDVVVIGEITLPSTLFKIASAEARQNVLELHKQLGESRAAAPPLVQYDFMRAAHTLASVNRTMGFTVVAELAYALEGWLQAHLDGELTLGKPDLVLLEQSIAALDMMVQAVCEKQVPQERSELVNQLIAYRHPPVSVVVEPQVIAQQASLAAAPVAAALPKAPAKAGTLQVRDDVDEQLLPVFLEEADDLCPKIGAGLRAWRDKPDDEQQAQQLKRLLHTLKGSARMAGAMRIGELAHGLEERILSAKQTRLREELWDELDSDFDGIVSKLDELREGKAREEPAFERREERRMPEPAAGAPVFGALLRVRSDVIDRLVNEAGEISVARSRMETEMRAFREGLLELTGSVASLRKQLREVEIQAESQMQARVTLARDSAAQFDPLEFDRFTRLQELTRFMNESVHDVQAVQQALLKNVDVTVAAMATQGRVNRELQQSLMNVRMVPFASISERLYRVVRKSAKELNKRANLELQGTGVELDRSVLEKMTAPFEHLLRNAIVHGLEGEELRVKRGKPAIGEIRLNLRHENNEVVFEFSDDGAGLNIDGLRKKAEARGLLHPGQAASDSQIAQLIFVSGISTAAEISEVAGRGIGMDVVRSEIAALGGRIDVSSMQGLGTHFIIHLPLTLAVTQVLMVRCGAASYAIPSTMVEQVRQAKPAELAQIYRDRQVEWHGNIYPFHYLPHLLGDDEQAPENLPRNPVLLLRSGDQRMALHVDELQGNHDAVVKNIGPQLARLPGIAGATVMGDGAVVLILNPVQLAQRSGPADRKPGKTTPEVLRTYPLVMVVDDSLTVRKITARLLERAGYQVVTAKDGVDALEQLSEINPAVMLLDIEMPRMDGFELTKHLRRDPDKQHLPIIMITSRIADKHRNYAFEMGVDAYLGKPYQEEELLQLIDNIINAPS